MDHGKSTLIKIILGKDSKYQGEIKLSPSVKIGYIPQEICYRDGLIPLRDGSISGLEYSTVILKGNKGINLLQQQVETNTPS